MGCEKWLFLLFFQLWDVHGQTFLNIAQLKYNVTCSASTVRNNHCECEFALQEEMNERIPGQNPWVGSEWQPYGAIEGLNAGWMHVQLPQPYDVTSMALRHKNSLSTSRFDTVRIEFSNGDNIIYRMIDSHIWQTVPEFSGVNGMRWVNISVVNSTFEGPGQGGLSGIRLFAVHRDVRAINDDICQFPYDQEIDDPTLRPIRNDYWCWDEGGQLSCNTTRSNVSACTTRNPLATGCPGPQYITYGPPQVEQEWCRMVGMCYSNNLCYACALNRYGHVCLEHCHCQDPNSCDQDSGPMSSCICENNYYKNETAGDHKCLPGEAPSSPLVWNDKMNQGQPATIHCQSEGWPVPDLSLTRDGSLVMQGFTNVTQTARSSFFTLANAQHGSVVVCKSYNAESSIIGSYTVQAFVQPELKSALEFESVNASTITVKWQPWDDSKGDTGDGPVVQYILHCDTDNPGTMKECLNDTTGIPQHTATGLKHHTVYKFAMQLVRPGLGGEGPQGTEYQQKTSCIAPGQPQSVAAVVLIVEYDPDIDSYKCDISWQAPEVINCDYIQRYIVHIESVNHTILKVYEVESLTLRTYLESNNTYAITVKSRNDENLDSAWTEPYNLVVPSCGLLPRK